jgi:hypothetical protein
MTLAGAGVLVAAPAHAAEAGGQSTGDSLFPNVGNTGYDVQHYDIELAYDETDGSIDATTTITADPTVELSSFSLDLEGLTVDTVTVNGEPATFERVQDVDATRFKLVITPAEVLTEEFTTVVEYSGVPTAHIDPDGSSEGWVDTPDGATAVSEPVGAMTWFPNNNTPLDKATFDFALTIPTQIDGGDAAAVSNGELVSQTENGDGTTTWVWEQQELMTTYLSLVSIGRFDMYTSDITLPSGRVIPEWSFIDPAIPAEDITDALDVRAELGAVLGALEESYGPYPGNSAGIVLDEVNVYYALETQDRPFFDYTEYGSSADLGTLIHEFVHQWFGNAVTLSDWSDIWLNEGPAEHITVQVSEALFDGDSSETTWYTEWDRYPAEPEDPADQVWDVPVAGFDDPAVLFGFQAYSRSAMTLEALRLVIGDEDFHEIFREWFAGLDGSDGSTADFTALAEEISGEDLDAFFQDWLFDLDKPAWPLTRSLELTTDTFSGEQLSRGDEVEYTVEVGNTGPTDLAGGTVEIDLSDVLASATVTSGPLATGLTLADGTLTWEVPPVASGAPAASVSFAVTIDDDAETGQLEATANAVDFGADCVFCTPVLAVSVPIEPVGVATISGTAAVGETLTADPGVWAEGTTFGYQWVRIAEDDLAQLEAAASGAIDIDAAAAAALVEPIAGATGATYLVQASDVGYAFIVVVVGSLPGFDPGVSVSEPTSVVAAVLPPASPTPSPTPTPGPAGLAATGTDAAPLAAASWGAAMLIAIGALSTTLAVRRRRA